VRRNRSALDKQERFPYSPRPADLSKAACVIRRGCLGSAICLAPSLAIARRTLGFGFCAPPYPPKCVSTPGTYESQAEIAKCQDDMNRYVNSVAAYRLCQTLEIERAVRETNATLQRWKSGVAANALCLSDRR
jgi:hypothetical protein